MKSKTALIHPTTPGTGYGLVRNHTGLPANKHLREKKKKCSPCSEQIVFPLSVPIRNHTAYSSAFGFMQTDKSQHQFVGRGKGGCAYCKINESSAKSTHLTRLGQWSLW